MSKLKWTGKFEPICPNCGLQERLKAIESPCTYCKGTRRVEAFADNISLGWGRCPHCASDVLEGQLAAKDKEIERLKAALGRLGEYTAQRLSPDEFIRLVQKTVKQILKGKQ
jgi:hypothetical protein